MHELRQLSLSQGVWQKLVTIKKQATLGQSWKKNILLGKQSRTLKMGGTKKNESDAETWVTPAKTGHKWENGSL